MDLISEECRLESYVRAWASVHRREQRERIRGRWRRARCLLLAPGLVGGVFVVAELTRPTPTPAVVVAGAVLVVAWLVSLVDPY